MTTLARLLPIVVAATFVVVVCCFTTVHAGADPYLDKYLASVRQNKHGLEDIRKLFADRGLDLNNVVENMGNNQEFAKLLLEKLSSVRDMGTIREGENGDQFYVFDNEVPDRPETLVLASCLTDLIRLLVDVSLNVEYASRMWVSRGKLDESAFYTLLFKDPGNRWLCQSVKENKTSQNPPFSGKYCYSAAFNIPAGLGTCVPDTCTEEDVNILAWLLMILIGIEPFYYVDCTEPTPWNTADIGFTAGLAFFALIVLCGSLYDIFLQQLVLGKMRGYAVADDVVKRSSQNAVENDYENVRDDTVEDDQGSDVATTSIDSAMDATDDVQEEMEGAKVNGGYDFRVEKEVKDGVTKEPPAHKKNVEVEIDDSGSSLQRAKRSNNLGWAVLHALLMSFSAVNNCKKLLSAKKTKNTMAVLNGLRVVSMFWVILGHSCSFYIGRLMNPLESLILTDVIGFNAITNATLSVDTFFVLSGFLVTYLTLKQIDSVRKRSTAQWAGFWSLFYFHRWWRLTPVYMAAMGIYALLMPHFGQGWNTEVIYEYIKSICRRQWWTHPLYINNLYPWPNVLDDSCMGWSWYLANDMQFYIISPLILIVLYKNGKAGLALVASIMFVSLSSLFGLNWHYGYTISSQEPYTDNVPDPENADTTYSKPYTRIPPYLAGMVVGYVMFKLKGKRIKMPPLMVISGWLAALTTLWFTLYGIWFSYQRMDVPQATAVMYLTFCRLAWGVGVGWIIFACLQDYGGPIGAILSWQIWIPLARLTYCAYLIHPVILFSRVYSDAVLFHTSYITISYLFVANVVLSYASALVLSLLVEGPTMGLEKVMFGKFKRS
eukprot:XP_792203.3 PREDICTED: nose resistant to fluoxetine protein 6 [Strongylocentrotus purpuratus]